jgi:hypothetical protein
MPLALASGISRLPGANSTRGSLRCEEKSRVRTRLTHIGAVGALDSPRLSAESMRAVNRVLGLRYAALQLNRPAQETL